ncbi:5-hydroxyisourate hydrolase-like isoform X1 [Bos javanicus]|uniref:5-hydroxyisourate hydrolase-like isoform X1 n=1 Tax=Bos javanicus TaxID=9906 RepID=UPI002AA6EA15|nr:5-hydroxyisourate hydrolase-like isoform X1 [Bos javanicus]
MKCGGREGSFPSLLWGSLRTVRGHSPGPGRCPAAEPPRPCSPRSESGHRAHGPRRPRHVPLCSNAPLPSCTDRDGRCPGLLPPGQMKAGTYKLSFDTKGYWQKRGQESFYPYVEVVFTITNETHKFHVPLLLSPWSYTTYRGS